MKTDTNEGTIRNLEDLPPVVTTKQLSQVTGIAEGTLKYFRHRGYGGPQSFALTPKCVRYRREDVIAWIEDRHRAEQQKQVSA